MKAGNTKKENDNPFIFFWPKKMITWKEEEEEGNIWIFENMKKGFTRMNHIDVKVNDNMKFSKNVKFSCE